MEELLTQPSFPEFVDWLVRNRAGKEDKPAAWAQENAWVPFYAGCPVCQLPYTVLKLEDPEEMEELMKHMKLKLPHWATPVHTIGGTSSSASKATRCFKSEGHKLIYTNVVAGILQNSAEVRLSLWLTFSTSICFSLVTAPRCHKLNLKDALAKKRDYVGKIPK